MLFKAKFSLCIFLFIFLQFTTVKSLSYNQPKFCPDVLWNPNGIIFADANSQPYGLFVDMDNMVYAAEQNTNRVQVWSSEGGNATKTISSDLNNPGAIFVTINSDIYVDSGNNNRVEKWTANATEGVIVMNVNTQCLGLFIDTNNTLFCAASNAHQVLAKSLNGNTNPLTAVAGTGISGSGANQLCLPNGIFVDINFSLYVADWCNNRIQNFPPGVLNGQTIVGNGSPGTIDLNGPTGVVLDADGYLFIVDMANNRIIGSGPNGFYCILGCSQTSGSLTSQFNGPRNLGFDSYGNLFVSDWGNSRILMFTLATNSCNTTSATIQSTIQTTTQTTIQTTVQSTIQTTTQTTIWMSSTSVNMYKQDATTTSQNTHNGVGKPNGFDLHLILWLVVSAFTISF